MLSGTMNPILRPATTASDFAALHLLRLRMAAWDVAMSEPLGVTGADVIKAYYGATPEDLIRDFTAPGACILLACDGDAPLGSLGFSRWQGQTAELRYFYVDEAARGRGLGRALMDETLARMTASGYRHAVLETAPFMTAAIALYRACGFADSAPFRPSPPGVGPASLFMARAL